MATATITKIEEFQTKVIDTMSSIEGPLVDRVKSVVSTLDARFPDAPELPFAEKIPTPTELVKNGYDFAADLLKANKKIVTSVTAATTPAVDVRHRR